MGSMRSAIFNLSRQQNGVVQMIRESRSFFAMNINSYYYSSQSKSEMTEKVKESMHNSAKKTGGELGDDSSEWSNVSEYKKEPIMEGWDEDKDEDEMKKQFEKDQGLGGKPFDEDQRLDVNWRPIDENKS